MNISSIQTGMVSNSAPPYARTTSNSAPPYAKNTPAFSGKKEENKAAVKRVQTEFLKQVSSGQTHKEAFFNSLKAIDEVQNEHGDKLCYADRNLNIEGVRASITPENIKPWLELIAFAVPILKEVIGLFGDLFKKPQAAPNEA